jgi:hypothetical protein
MRVILDHSIVGQELTSLTIRKDRELAACRICGAIFQPKRNTDTPDALYTQHDANLAGIEIIEWRRKHNLSHSEKEHVAFIRSGRTLTPEAAQKLAPFGLVPLSDSQDPEIAQAMREASRAPTDDVQTTLKGVY